MGHQNCGAVDAVLNNQAADIPAIAKLIAPSVKKARKSRLKNPLEKAIQLNAEQMRKNLLDISAIKKLVKSKQLEIRAAYYDLDTGSVTILND